jgi:hypothetical protein
MSLKKLLRFVKIDHKLPGIFRGLQRNAFKGSANKDFGNSFGNAQRVFNIFFDNALHRLGEGEKSVRKMYQPIGNKGPVRPSSLRVSVYTRNVLSISSKWRGFMTTNKKLEMRQKILKPSISHLVILNLV